MLSSLVRAGSRSLEARCGVDRIGVMAFAAAAAELFLVWAGFNAGRIVFSFGFLFFFFVDLFVPACFGEA